MENNAKSFNIKMPLVIILLLIIVFAAYYFFVNNGNLFKGQLTKELGMNEDDCTRTFSTFIEDFNNVSIEEMQYCYEKYPELWRDMKPTEMMDPVFDNQEIAPSFEKFKPAETSETELPQP